MPLDVAPGKGPQFGIATFNIPGSHVTMSCSADPKQDLLEQVLLADEVGIDFIGINEAFGRQILGMNPFDLVIEFAEQTKQIRFCTSLADIHAGDLAQRHRDFHRVLDLTGKRVEIVLDRDRFAAGKHSESNPVFNENLAEWNSLINGCGERVTWIEVSGQSDAIIQAASYRIPMMLQIFQGNPLDSKPFVDMYHTANSRFGAGKMPLGLLVPGFIADTDEAAIEASYGPWQANFPVDAPEDEKYKYFLHEVEHGSLFIGSPDTVATKMAKTIEHLGLDRFYLRYTCGLHTHANSMNCIRLFGEEVIPRVRTILGVS